MLPMLCSKSIVAVWPTQPASATGDKVVRPSAIPVTMQSILSWELQPMQRGAACSYRIEGIRLSNQQSTSRNSPAPYILETAEMTQVGFDYKVGGVRFRLIVSFFEGFMDSHKL